MLNGIKLAVDEINAVGGYLGRPLELVIKDDRADPDQGRKVSQELLAEKVVATIGFCNSGVALKAIDLFQDAKSPLIVPCATATAITASAGPCRMVMPWSRANSAAVSLTVPCPAT